MVRTGGYRRCSPVAYPTPSPSLGVFTHVRAGPAPYIGARSGCRCRRPRLEGWGLNVSDRYRRPRHRTAAVLAAITASALLGGTGCATPNHTPAVDKPSAAGPSAGGSPAKLEALVEYTLTLPEPKGAPPGGIWSDVRAGEDGFESVYYTDKAGQGYVGVTLLDCRLPRVQAQKANPKDDAVPCFGKPNGRIKGYPL